ncbi:transcription initiation factor IIA large subunit [[Candida] jaroonii]|uniref:Transcription initiation factor IIA large subunit n=1 Tax=[Candida] jaroonii TaxID=467808 RepID=A0ACA9Y422_9ASCO|nr:transcription initiation factor IIA large subunit [[Candida] jaroonii]
MSNTESSRLYETIIDEVINDSRQDFENSGIEESTLQELKRIWCEKLTQSQVAKFSWDNQPTFQQNISHQPFDNDIKLEHPDLLSYNTGSVNNVIGDNNDLDIQIPNMTSFKQEYDDDDNGLMLPTVTQTDGSNFEITLDNDNAKEFINNLKKLKGVDGVSDDDNDLFNDSDDINSELDDDLESGKSDDEENDQDGHIMLCLYDKVQRIKNKWKCNLKEGVANINGKDYVFQKATGESEW